MLFLKRISNKKTVHVTYILIMWSKWIKVVNNTSEFMNVECLIRSRYEFSKLSLPVVLFTKTCMDLMFITNHSIMICWPCFVSLALLFNKNSRNGMFVIIVHSRKSIDNLNQPLQSSYLFLKAFVLKSIHIHNMILIWWF